MGEVARVVRKGNRMQENLKPSGTMAYALPIEAGCSHGIGSTLGVRWLHGARKGNAMAATWTGSPRAGRVFGEDEAGSVMGTAGGGYMSV